MSVQESIAAALREHDCWVSGEGWTYCDTCRVTVRSAEDHLAAVAMDAARAAVVALPEGRAEIHGGWVRFVDRAAVLDLLTPAREEQK